jgi:hypothetical protein
MRYFHAMVFLLTLLTLAAVGQDCNKHYANAFINDLFKKGQFISYDSTMFRGFSKELALVETPTLNRLLPNYCFFSTFFYSSNLEYPKVETAVALSKSSKASSRIVHSPVYTRTPADFINLFKGIETSDTTERIRLAKDITTIFAAITYKGHIGRVVNLRQKDVVSFELWHDELSWRIYNFHFDKNGKLTEIEIDKGIRPEVMNSSYSRM